MFKFALSWARPREPPSPGEGDGFPYSLGTRGPCIMGGAMARHTDKGLSLPAMELWATWVLSKSELNSVISP